MIEFELIDETQNIEFNLEDNSQEIKFDLTDYDDTEVRELIDNVDTKVDDLSTEAHQGFNVLSNAINNLEINKANRTEVDTLSDKVDSNTAQISQNKADISTLNDKVDNIHVPSKISELVNDTGFITKAVTDLVNYYKKNETYTKEEVNNIVSSISSGLFRVVDTLPTTGENYVIYLVPSENPKVKNEKDEFIWVNSKWEQIGSTAIDLSNYYTKTEVDGKVNVTIDGQTYTTVQDIINMLVSEFARALDTKQSEITSANKLSSSLVDDTNSENKFTTPTEKTIWNNKADYGFVGIIDGTSANPINGATLPNGVYKASEDHISSYISLPMEDGTTKRQSVQKGGIVIRTTARLEILATQCLMYQYDTSNQYFYPAESFIESNLRRKYDDGLAYLGTVSPPNNVFITTPITELEATINTGDTGHVRITFTVGDGVAEGDFHLGLTNSDGNDLIYKDGATPKPVTGETWILEFYGNTCEAICFKTTDGKSREDLLKQFMRRNSNQIYFPDVDGKPNVSIMAAKGYEQDRKVGLEAQNIEFTNFQNWTYYGIPNYVPLDLSLYNTTTQANMLHPYTQLPDGDYWVKNSGKIWLGNESYELIGKEYIHKKGTTLTIWGGEYACAYYSWNATDGVYEGGFFITYQDLLDYISEQGFEKGYTITRQTTATGSIVINNGRHYKRVRETGVTSLTFSLTNNLGEVPDAFKARVTLRTATTFTAFNVTQRDAYKLYFVGDDCANGVITGVANKYYDIEFKADGFGNVVGIVHSYTLPTT